MMRHEDSLNSDIAAPGGSACLGCHSSVLVWSCPGWLHGGACVARAALLQGASCMKKASQPGSGTLRWVFYERAQLLQSDSCVTVGGEQVGTTAVGMRPD